MLRSRLLCKTTTDPPRDALTVSHKLLTRGSFFRPGSASGFWETLPLGKRVLDKLEDVISSQMTAMDSCQKVDLPCLMDAEPWKKTGRWTSETEMFRVKDRKSKELLLAPTHEEAFASLVADMYGVLPSSLLPLSLFQIGRKFRDELRPRAGLLRAREFIMKDLYTFDESQEKALLSYEKVCASYEHIFAHVLKIPVLKATAVSGNMGGTLSHEFHLESSAGEDTVLRCDRGDFCANMETFSERVSTCTCPTCSCKGTGRLVETKCIEVGHCFLLGTKYSEPLKARCIPFGEKSPRPLHMGSYGLGLTRIVAALAEVLSDEHGIVWPDAVAPFRVVLVPSPNASAARVTEVVAELKKTIDMLVDDRSNASYGFKMKDAQLIGAPFVCTVETDGSLNLYRRIVGGLKRLGSFPSCEKLGEAVKSAV